MTLAFLGHRPEREIKRIAAILDGIDRPAPELRFLPDPVGRPPGRPRLYAIEAESPGAVELQAEVSDALERARLYEPEDRDFWPHVTVARTRRERRGSSKPAKVDVRPRAAPGGARTPVRFHPNASLPFPPQASGCPVRAPELYRLESERVMAQEKRVPLVMESRPASARTSDKDAKAKDAALKAAVTQIERRVRRRVRDEARQRHGDGRRGDPHRRLSRSTWRSASAACRRAGSSRFGPEASGKTTLVYHIIAQAQARGRGLRVHRRRALDRPDLRPQDRRRHRRAPDLPARLRRAGTRDRRRPDPLGRGRSGGRRLGRGIDAAGQLKGQMGEVHGRPPGPPDVAGAAQARRQPRPGPRRSACSPTRSARRSAFRSATRRRSRAGER